MSNKVIFTYVASMNHAERWRDPNLCCFPQNNLSILWNLFLMKRLRARYFHWWMKYNNSSAPDAAIKIMTDRSLHPLQYILHRCLTCFETPVIGGPPRTCASAMEHFDHFQICLSAISRTVQRIVKWLFKQETQYKTNDEHRFGVWIKSGSSTQS